MKYTKYYRMWLEDTVEPEGGTWCYMGADDKNFLWQLNFNYQDNEHGETLEQYLQWGYKIEEL
ncbi:MAG: hypothetical protein EBR30_14810 [Cytophagia bacterium]|nr:hypothetical protein [Cytophagia bacterium]